MKAILKIGGLVWEIAVAVIEQKVLLWKLRRLEKKVLKERARIVREDMGYGGEW